MQRLPNLFLIGAQKGGSTYLASLLEASPDIAFFAGKEPNIFNRDTPDACRKVLRELAGDQQAAKYLLDASVNYTRHPYFPETAANLKAVLGDAGPRFIYILRDPVERMISHYFFNRERWGEGLSFNEAITTDDRYVWPGRYDVQIERFLAQFPRGSFYFLTFDALVAAPQQELSRLMHWLGARIPDVLPPAGHARNATDKRFTRSPRYPALNRLVRGNPLLHRLATALPVRWQARLNRIFNQPVPREEIPHSLRCELYRRHFADSVAKAQALTGLDLSAWQTRYDEKGAS